MVDSPRRHDSRGDPRTPVTVVTGPAGEAWIRGEIERGAWRAAAVLKGHVGGAPTAGCACCTVRGELHGALRALLPRARRGDIDRVVIRTEGPADSSLTLMADPMLASVYRVEEVVTVPDRTRAQSRSPLVADPA